MQEAPACWVPVLPSVQASPGPRAKAAHQEWGPPSPAPVTPRGRRRAFSEKWPGCAPGTELGSELTGVQGSEGEGGGDNQRWHDMRAPGLGWLLLSCCPAPAPPVIAEPALAPLLGCSSRPKAQGFGIPFPRSWTPIPRKTWPSRSAPRSLRATASKCAFQVGVSAPRHRPACRLWSWWPGGLQFGLGQGLPPDPGLRQLVHRHLAVARADLSQS